MPYKIEEDDGQFCVVKEGADGGRMKCYDAEADAQDYLTALNAAEADKAFVLMTQREAGYVALSAALEIPVAAGETECTRWQFEERLRQKAVDLILPDICRAGGITEGRKIALVADLHNVRWAAHVSMGTSVHVAAAAHLAAASANFLIFEFSSTPNPIGDVLLTEPLHPIGGTIRVPDGPGLGITFDESKLQQHLL